MNALQGSVQTVTGLMDPSDLGITHSHEHVLWDYFQMIRSYDVIFDDVNVAEEEVRLFAAAGGDPSSTAPPRVSVRVRTRFARSPRRPA